MGSAADLRMVRFVFQHLSEQRPVLGTVVLQVLDDAVKACSFSSFS